MVQSAGVEGGMHIRGGCKACCTAAHVFAFLHPAAPAWPSYTAQDIATCKAKRARKIAARSSFPRRFPRSPTLHRPDTAPYERRTQGKPNRLGHATTRPRYMGHSTAGCAGLHLTSQIQHTPCLALAAAHHRVGRQVRLQIRHLAPLRADLAAGPPARPPGRPGCATPRAPRRRRGREGPRPRPGSPGRPPGRPREAHSARMSS
jgi:hypothetical protein